MRMGFMVIIASIVAMGFSGCASNGNTAGAFNDPEKIQQIHINRSTKKQVKSLFGTPQSITKHSDGTESWVYKSKNTTYTEKYAAKKAISFIPIPYLGTAVGLADNVADIGPDKIVEVKSFTLRFSKRGILKESKLETETL